MSASMTVQAPAGARYGRIALGAIAAAFAIVLVLVVTQVAAPKAGTNVPAGAVAQPTWDHGSSLDVSNVPLIMVNGPADLPASERGSSSGTSTGAGPTFDHGSSTDLANRSIGSDGLKGILRQPGRN